MSYEARHTFEVYALCPADPEVIDRYEGLAVVTDSVLEVETLLEAVKSFRGRTIWQEELTQLLANACGCVVITAGVRSGVETKVRAEPAV